MTATISLNQKSNWLLCLAMYLFMSTTIGLFAQQAATKDKKYDPAKHGTFKKPHQIKVGDRIWVNGRWQPVRKITKFRQYYFVQRTYHAKIDEQVWLETQTQPRLFIHTQTKDTLSLYYDPETGIDNYSLPLAQRHYDHEPLAPRTWRFIDFVMLNGQDTTAVLWLGRPMWWMEYHQANKVGNKVWLEMPEQGISGYATVTGIKDCKLDTRLWKTGGKRKGRPVIGKFQRWSSNIWNYTFDTGETIGATPAHPFYSLDRQAYIPIGDIKLKERIRTHSGKPARLTAKKKRPGREKVYNLEIHKDHNFYVGRSMLSVHNSYITGVPASKQPQFLKHQGKFEAQGNTIVIKDQALLKEVEALGSKKEAFYKDLVENGELVDAVVGNPKLVDGWKALQNASPSVRRNPDNLAKAKKYLDETGESITAFQRKVPVAGQKKWLDDIVGHWEQLKKLKPEFKKLNLSDAEINSIIKLYKDSPDLIPRLKGTIDELITHGGLSKESKLILLKSEEYIKAFVIRKQGIETIPQWMTSGLVVNQQKLKALWLTNRKGEVLGEIPAKRLDKIQKYIDEYNPKGIKVVLGMQNPEHGRVIKEIFNNNSQGIRFLDDNSWPKAGFISPGIRNFPMLNFFHGVETMKRISSLGLKLRNSITTKGIMFNLTGYDVRQAMSAIYSNPNWLGRGFNPPPLGFNKTKMSFSYTGVTDFELANVVRNKDWFDMTTFYKIENGKPIILTKEQVMQGYGIKYIGDIIKK